MLAKLHTCATVWLVKDLIHLHTAATEELIPSPWNTKHNFFHRGTPH